MPIRETIAQEPQALALGALAWTLADDARAGRLLALTGLTPEDLRQSVGSASTLAAVLGFLEAHEPDLINCAEALTVTPQQLVAARASLEA